MKNTVTLFLIFTLVNCLQVTKSEYALTSKLISPIKEIGDFFLNKTGYYCPNIEEQIRNASYDAERNCSRHITFSGQTICSTVKNNLKTCVGPVIEVFARCLPEDSKKVPAMVLDMALAVFAQACKSTGEQTLEILLNRCTMDKHILTFDVCREMTDTVEEYIRPDNKIITKDVLCKLVPKIRSCFKQHQEVSCHDPQTRRAFNTFYDEIEKSIKDNC